MKKLFLIYILSTLVFFCKAQTPVVNRGTSPITVVDARLRAALNFGVPIVADTLNSIQGGNDSVGLMIYVRIGTRKGMWYRDTVVTGGHRWVLFASLGKTVASYGKNATRDSTILLLSDGTRYAAKDSIGGSGTSPSVVIIIDSSHFEICNVNSCDTFTTVNNFNTIQVFNDSTIIVCSYGGSCDTININPTPIIPTGIFVDSVFMTHAILTDSLWQGKNGDTTLINVFDKNCGIIRQGVVTYDSLLIFTISPSIYILCSDGVRRTSVLTNITLSAADATFDRFDALILDSNGVNKITGTPSATPVQPQIGVDQLLLTYILIPALATSLPACTTPDVIIYDENTGSPEWSHTSTATVNFSSTTTPYHLTKEASVSAYTNGKNIIFTTPTTIAIGSYSYLKFFIRSNYTMSKTFNSFQVSWVTSVGSANVTVTDGTYGFKRNTTGSWQTIIIPITDFYAGNTCISCFWARSDVSLRITLNGSNTHGLLIDYIQLGGSCIVQPPVTGHDNGFGIVSTNSGTAVSTQPNDVLQVVGTNNITVSATGKTLTIGGGGNDSAYVNSLSPADSLLILIRDNGGQDTVVYRSGGSGSGGSMVYPAAGIAVSTGSAWGSSIANNSSNWNTAYTNMISTFTTIGSSGAATLGSNTLNIPNYTLAGLGGISKAVDTLYRTVGKDSLQFTIGGRYHAILDSAGGSGGVVQANNGDTLVAGYLGIGGQLVRTTTIDGNDFDFIIQNNRSTSAYALTIKNNGSSGHGIYVEGPIFGIETHGQYGFYSEGTSYGGVSYSPTGIGLQAWSNSSWPLQAVTNGADSTSVYSMFQMQRQTFGTPQNNMGASIDYIISTTAGTQLSNQLISKWTDATDATRTSQFIIAKVLSGVTANGFILNGSGVINIPTNTATFANNAAAVSGGLVQGDIYWTTAGQLMRVL